MNEIVKKKRAQRLAFMTSLYKLTDGEQLVDIPLEKLADHLRWDLKMTNSVFDYLVEEGLAERPGFGGGAAITHEGVREVEEALTNPETPTEHFPPVVNVYVGGDVIGSQVQAGTARSSQEQKAFLGEDRENTLKFVSELRRVLADERVDELTRAEGHASLVAVTAQLELERPNAGLLREGLHSLRAIAENLIASGAWVGGAEVLRHLPPFS